MAFLGQSTYTMDQFDDARHQLSIGHGLEAIGETRFGTIYWSLLRGFPAMVQVVKNPALVIENEVC
jgi:hypothetical protein